MTYEALAMAQGQSYSTTSIQAAILSDGRGKQTGLRLLQRVPGRDRREKCLVVSRTGRAIAKLFAGLDAGAREKTECGSQDLEAVADHLKARTLEALSVVLQAAPDVNLTTFCVLLFVAQNGERFGHYGDPSASISETLGISNLSRNLAKLAGGSDGRPGLGLVEFKSSPTDRRVKLPCLSEQGLALVMQIAAALLESAPSPVRRAKDIKLQEASGPEAVVHFDDNAFDIIELDDIHWRQDENKAEKEDD